MQGGKGLIVRRRGGHIGVIAGLRAVVKFDTSDITIITGVDPVAVRLQRIEDIAEIGYRLRARTATAIPIELVILPATFALGAVLALPLVAGLLDALLEFFFRLFLVLLELRVIELLEKNRILMQSQMSKRVRIKHTPHLNFHIDEAMARGSRVLNVMNELGLMEIQPHVDEEL